MGANLAARRPRRLLVADDVPDGLKRIVEFLDAAMPPPPLPRPDSAPCSLGVCAVER